MTLTTERLKTIAAWRAKYGAGHNVIIPSEEAEEMARALLANREAQPVALVDRRPAASGGICWQHGGKDLQHGTELFTAPPAPTVPDEIDSFADQVIGTKNKIIRLPAPLYVPHEGLKVYLDADALLSCIERQGIFVLFDSI
ncbi:hypothetical protein V6294_15855 [Serratia marcescens]|uniref:hypothetical protein n=1 Tax=Serratia marcescens TaxID=615 RepID=UPI003B879C84